ncbi:probable serine/threonine-protein kinase roco9 [Benincasa hispida]|uniref:probable serine/threonine-protein kinase roco9 n=1 Tax=Benincasa hispida TaxID=102211 RepID=UPI001901475C|nr:probable serine/threonine-protein kinase roco9 [Benincasa hispida]
MFLQSTIDEIEPTSPIGVTRVVVGASSSKGSSDSGISSLSTVPESTIDEIEPTSPIGVTKAVIGAFSSEGSSDSGISSLSTIPEVGSPVPPRALISQVLLGLDEEYNAIVATIQGRIDISWLDIQSKLLLYEKRLEYQTNQKTIVGFNQMGNTSVNMTNTKNTNNNNNKKSTSNNNNQASGRGQRGGGHGRGRGRGRGNKPISQGMLKDGLYQLEDAEVGSSKKAIESRVSLQLVHKNNNLCALALSNRNRVSKTIWYRHLDHPSLRTLDFIVKQCNLPIMVNEDLQFCDSCRYGKTHSLDFPNSNSRVSTLFDLIHTDLWGPAPLLSTDGYKYYVIFVDDHSRYT